MKRLKIGWQQAWVVAALVSCITAGLCIMFFCGGKGAQGGQALPRGGGVVSVSATSVDRAGGERSGSSDADSDADAGAFCLG